MVFSKEMRFLSCSFAPFTDRSSGKTVGMYKISLHDPESGVPHVFNVMENSPVVAASADLVFGDHCVVEFDLQPKDKLFSLRLASIA